MEALARQALGVIQVAPVKDHRRLEACVQQVEVRRLELLPLGADDQGVGPAQGRFRGAHQHQARVIAVQPLGFLHGLGVEGPHVGAGGP